MGKIDKQIISLLEKEKSLSLVAIADQIGKPSKTVFRSLRRLFSNGEINFDPRNRQYTLAKE
ncbi:MAG: winged helix-turn-helix transcriptional regulator [Candidatus Bathyarchaeota archaeon]|nr:MAG: winged helix-turn-helix transcriptional regulator [Candidatus Bathyarchaeota archaeon]